MVVMSNYTIIEMDGEFHLLDNVIDEVIFKSKNDEDLLSLKEYLDKKDKKLTKEFNDHQIVINSQNKIIDFYQTLIMKTLSDKLADVDNMFAMKTMLKEACDMLEGLIPKLESMKEKDEK